MIRERAEKNLRLDINGLRAIAVIGVVAFHFKLGPLRAGGFAGVDVFFAISGFLMTQIITSRFDRSCFSFSEFVMARTRRIVPAFVVLVLSVLGAASFLLNPLRLESLGERGIWSLIFLSNVLYAKQGDYFDAPQHNWLLHTWSLSVEWQYYLIFPLVLLLFNRFSLSRRVEIVSLMLIAFFSFVMMLFSLQVGGNLPKWSFYLLSSRAWEFLAGALASYAAPQLVIRPRSRLALHYTGMAGILSTMLFLHVPTPWPSIWTLLPVLGATATLLACYESPRWAELTPVRLAGLWSYSIYLWHWPIAAALMTFGNWSLGVRLCGVAAAFGLGAGSHVFIERWATDLLWRERWRLWRLGLPAFAFAVVAAVTTQQTVGFETIRYRSDPALLAKLRDFRTARDDWFATEYCDLYGSAGPLLPDCRYGNPNSNDVLVIGDSFAQQVSARYHEVFRGAPFGIEFVTHGGCIPIPKTTHLEYAISCDEWTEAVYRYALRSNFKRILFFAYWPNYAQGRLCIRWLPNCGLSANSKTYANALEEGYLRLAELWLQLRHQGKTVIVFDVTPYAGDNDDPIHLYDKVAAGALGDTLEISFETFMASHRATTQQLEKATSYAGVTLVNPAVALCPNKKCPIVRNGQPLYTNGSHLRTSMMRDARFAIFDRYVIPEGAQSR